MIPCRFHHPIAEFIADHAGHPLGPGMPLGRTIRGEDGTTHLDGWAEVVRRDPCALCGRPTVVQRALPCPVWRESSPPNAASLDHVEPKSATGRGLGGAHTWLNFSGACVRCNTAKADRALLWFLMTRPACQRKPVHKPRGESHRTRIAA